MTSRPKTYLCQIGENVSCGACCGLYNVPDISRRALSELLSERAKAFSKVPRTEEAIDAFGLAETRKIGNSLRPCPDFHHCPFLGLVGEKLSRVGCLLHPLGNGNNGVDLRGLSWYGAFACHSYFCPTHHDLSEEYKRIVKAVSNDWYLYGLAITETGMLHNFFGTAEKKLGTALTADFIGLKEHRARAVLEFLSLNEAWPYRPEKSRRKCHYFFRDGLSPDELIPYDALGVDPSPMDPALRALGSVFPDAGALLRAEAMLDEILEAVIS
jgi:hypothetical protein